jgi:hypothetical protein
MNGNGRLRLVLAIIQAKTVDLAGGSKYSRET